MNNAKPVKRRKGYIRLAMLVLLLVFAVRSLAGIRSNALETVLVQYGEVKIEEETKGVIIRNERLIKAPISGKVSFIAQENVKVPVNAKLLEVRRDRIDEETIRRYNEINQKIEALNNMDSENAGVEVGRGIHQYLSNISYLILSGNLLPVYYEKERLTREISKSTALDSSGSNLDTLIQEKEKIEEVIEDGIKVEHAEFSGVPVYTLDGYEEVLTVEHLDEVDLSKLKPADSFRINIQDGVKAGEPVLKLVDNCKWHIATELTREFGENLKEGSRISVRFIDKEDATVDARIERLSDGNNGIVAFLEIKDYVPGMLEERFVNISVIRNRYRGYVIPVNAIAQKGDGAEVMVLQGGKIVAKKIVVKGSDGENAVVESGQEGYKLKLYDKVIINWEKFGGSKDGH
jgi:putative membrane fusion protein